MATVELLIRAKNESDAAFGALQKSLERGGQAAKKFDADAQAMSKSLASTTQRAGTFADALSRTSTSLARSADAFGLPAQALRTLDDVAEVASMGFQNLTSSAAGFNAASIGVAGAGLAIGTAIGTWLRTFPAVTEAADNAAAALMRLFGVNAKSATEAAAATANWAIEQKKIAAAYQELQLRMTKGMSAKEMQAYFYPEPPKDWRTQQVEKQKALEDASKKAQELALKEAIAFDQANQKAEADHKASLARQARDEKAFVDVVTKEAWRLESEIEKSMQARTKAVSLAILDQYLAYRAMVDAQVEDADRLDKALKDGADARKAAFMDALGSLSGALSSAAAEVHGLGGAFLQLGADGIGVFMGLDAWAQRSADHAMTSAEKIQAVAGALQGAMSAFNSGSFLGGAGAGAAAGAAFGPIGAGIGAVAGGLLGLFGGAKKAREEMERLKASFLGSVGGMAALQSRAREAGIALDAMFKAKSAAALEAAMAGIKSQLDSWAEAQEKLQAAMDKYGLTVEQMGPKFAQQQLDKQAADLLQAYKLLTGAGAENDLVLQKMSEDMNKYIQTSLKAGTAIPESMRPMIQRMIEMGLLTDESGKAFGSIEEAGVKFTESLTEGLGRAIDAINRLVSALMQGINVPAINVPVNYVPNGQAPGGNSPSYHGGGGDFPGNAFGGFYTQPTLAWLGEAGPARGGEYALPEERLAKLMAQAASTGATQALSASGGGGREGDVYLNQTRVGRQLVKSDSFRRALRTARRAA